MERERESKYLGMDHVVNVRVNCIESALMTLAVVIDHRDDSMLCMESVHEIECTHHRAVQCGVPTKFISNVGVCGGGGGGGRRRRAGSVDLILTAVAARWTLVDRSNVHLHPLDVQLLIGHSLHCSV